MWQSKPTCFSPSFLPYTCSSCFTFCSCPGNIFCYYGDNRLMVIALCTSDDFFSLPQMITVFCRTQLTQIFCTLTLFPFFLPLSNLLSNFYCFYPLFFLSVTCFHYFPLLLCSFFCISLHPCFFSLLSMPPFPPNTFFYLPFD